MSDQQQPSNGDLVEALLDAAHEYEGTHRYEDRQTFETAKAAVLARMQGAARDTAIVDHLEARFQPVRNQYEAEKQEVTVSHYTNGTLRTVREVMAERLADPRCAVADDALRARLERARAERAG